MGPKELKLPEIPEEAFVLNPAFEKIYRILWAVDPAILRRLKDATIINIARINIDYRVKVARLEAQIKEAEAKALEETAKELARRVR